MSKFEDCIKEFYELYFKKYQNIIDIMKLECDEKSICVITQKEIAVKLNYSQGLISKCLRRLERSDKCIEKIKPGIYKLNHIDMKKYGPFAKFITYLIGITKHEDFLNIKCIDRGILTNMSRDEAIMAHYYFVEYIKVNK